MTFVIRKVHRWASLVFTLVVSAIFAGMTFMELPEWFYYLPLPPLAVLLPTGIYMFVLPYFSGQRDGTPAHEGRT
ncbi:hypothetical protein [Aminobacter sp. AP02]|uniref:hypothetical protein n=1 Tax=Aminobacter sp. AP02 TaxID=2135737 RepID=UPI000D6CD029|nr:hypothetical protein [Aminobacter sp. AP02]PWK72563.1 hypothetical protein C8K44_1053 [Aminobacter sp. AP02]